MDYPTLDLHSRAMDQAERDSLDVEAVPSAGEACGWAPGSVPGRPFDAGKPSLLPGWCGGAGGPGLGDHQVQLDPEAEVAILFGAKAG
ncbi:hypothetical protein ACWCY1_37870, partial [Streptomyces goshikiensis]